MKRYLLFALDEDTGEVTWISTTNTKEDAKEMAKSAKVGETQNLYIVEAEPAD